MINFACKRFKIEEVIKCSLGLSKADLKVMKSLLGEDWQTSEIIAQDLNLNLSTVQRAVKKLFESKVILRQQHNLKNGGYTYLYKSKSKENISKVILEKVNLWVELVEKEFKEW